MLEVGFEKGWLEVVEILIKFEIYDNIVVFWMFEKLFNLGELLYFVYEFKIVE